MSQELEDLISARKLAEAAVQDMQDGPLRVAAYSAILNSLLQRGGRQKEQVEVGGAIADSEVKRPSNSIVGRILQLKDDGYFQELRSLAEIQGKLAEFGWHYPQTMISTPLRRLVQQRQLRRLQAGDGGKKIWRYVNP